MNNSFQNAPYLHLDQTDTRCGECGGELEPYTPEDRPHIFWRCVECGTAHGVRADAPAEQDRFEMPANDYAPAGCVELDGVLYCVAHDGIIDELSSRIDRDGNIVCDQWDEYDDLCRMVPLFIRVTEGH